ncbi:MAG: ABC transporter substrate-binding protein [Clostridiales bacterium]|jgi:putative aldouronate transport system substrate-binding protein|nr:ABC transporter substrate-binding protein [Clostridiales bacterium]
MRLKRNAAAVLALLLSVVLLASCANGGGDAKASSSPATGSATSAPNADVSAPEPSADSSETSSDAKTYDKKLTISFASIMVKDGVDYNADAFSKMWQEKFNIEWDVIGVLWDDWAEKMRIWINAGDLPDLSTWDYQHGEILTYADQDLIKRLPDDWKTRWPSAAKAYTDTGLAPQVEEILGGTYCIPKPRFSNNKPADVLPNNDGITFRKDWFEAVGAEVKDTYTIQELLEIARKIKQQDPGELGDRLVPIDMNTGNLTGAFVYNQYAHAESPADFYVGPDGTYKWGPADPETLEALQVYQGAFKEGLLHPEFYTILTEADLQDYRIRGVAAIIATGGMTWQMNHTANQISQNQGLDPAVSMGTAVILDKNQKYNHAEVINYWTAQIFRPDIEDEKFERIMDMLDYQASDEGQLEVRLGIKDLDWRQEADGTLVNLIEEGKSVDIKYDSIMPLYMNMLVLSDDFDTINPAYPLEYRQKVDSYYKLKTAQSDATTLVPTDWNVFFHDSPAKRQVAFNYEDEYAELVLKDGDLEANWQAWIANKMVLVQPVIDELNARLNS